MTLPDNGDILIAGGAEWTGTEVSDVGNNKSTVFDRGNDSLSLGADMNRRRWYASALPLMNGEIYVQGGKSGEDLPEVRQRDGSYRLLEGAPTSAFHFYYPRNFVAPDGKVFGFDINGLMYSVTTEGDGSISTLGQIDTTLMGRPSTAVMYRPGQDPDGQRQEQSGRDDRHRRHNARRCADGFVVIAARVGHGNRACRMAAC